MRRLPKRLQTGVATTLLATQLMACTSWHVVDPAPLPLATPPAPQPAQSIRVTLADSTQLVWDNPVIVDGRIGTAPDVAPGVELTDVRRLEMRRFSWSKTTLLVGLIAGVAAGLAAFGEAMGSGFYGGGISIAGPW